MGTDMEGHIHGGIYTRGRYTHEKAHTWRDTHGRTYTRGGHTHGEDIHTEGT